MLGRRQTLCNESSVFMCYNIRFGEHETGGIARSKTWLMDFKRRHSVSRPNRKKKLFFYLLDNGFICRTLFDPSRITFICIMTFNRRSFHSDCAYNVSCSHRVRRSLINWYETVICWGKLRAAWNNYGFELFEVNHNWWLLFVPEVFRRTSIGIDAKCRPISMLLCVTWRHMIRTTKTNQ